MPNAWTIATVLIASGLGLFLSLRSSASGPADRIALFALPLFGLYLLFGSAVMIAFFSRLSAMWAGARLATALSLLHGYDWYYGPGEGPLGPWIYGPVSLFLWLPAAVASTPRGAIHIAGAVTALTFFGSALCVCLAATRGLPRRGLRIFLGFAFFSFLTPITRPMPSWAYSVAADGPALAVASLALALSLGRRAEQRSLALLSATFAVLSVWTKQTMVPLLIALPIHEALSHGGRAGLRYVAYTAVSGLCVSLLFVLTFGFEPLFFTMFVLPASYSLPIGATNVLSELLVNARIPLAVVLVGGSLHLVLRRSDGPRALAEAWRSRPWAPCLLVGLFMLPTSVVSRMKVGSTLGSDITIYYLCLAAALMLPQLVLTAARGALGNLSRAAFTVAAIAVAWLAGTSLWTKAQVNERLRPPRSIDAFAFAKAHPEKVYFPFNPLVTLLADGRLDHFQTAVAYYEMVKLGPTRDHFRRYLPPRLEFVAIDGLRAQPLSRHLPEFDKKRDVAELPDVSVFVR